MHQCPIKQVNQIEILLHLNRLNPQGEAISDPIATNFSSATGTGDNKTAEVSTVAESYSGDEEQSEKGSVHLQNNSNIPDTSLQGTLPDTDSIQLPIDSDTNL
jgi:hypothetical protein